MSETEKSEIKFEHDNNDPEELLIEQKETNLAQQKWENACKEIENITDSLGHHIDKNIKETVVSLNVLNINTAGSCEGHIDSGMSAPWVLIAAPNEPEERFIGQNEVFEKVAIKYNMPIEEAKRMFNVDVYWEAIHGCIANGETKDYEKWKKESEKLLFITKEVLSDFYKDRNVPDNIKIKVDSENLEDMAEGSFEIYNGGEDHRNIYNIELSKEEKDSLSNRLNEYREEMQIFAKFIKDKLFSEGENYIINIKNKVQEKIDKEKIGKIRERIENNL